MLFQKMGVGRLDMYVLHPPPPPPPTTPWPPCVPPAGGTLRAPPKKVVRVLFPGCTPPARLLDGLVRLQHLGFLRSRW